MGYIDIIIPLAAGIVFSMMPEKLLKAGDPNFEKKRKQIRICGFVLIGVAVLYFVAKKMG